MSEPMFRDRFYQSGNLELSIEGLQSRPLSKFQNARVEEGHALCILGGCLGLDPQEFMLNRRASPLQTARQRAMPTAPLIAQAAAQSVPVTRSAGVNGAGPSGPCRGHPGPEWWQPFWVFLCPRVIARAPIARAAAVISCLSSLGMRR